MMLEYDRMPARYMKAFDMLLLAVIELIYNTRVSFNFFCSKVFEYVDESRA